jgi:trans-aconitate methyltransferase
LETPRTDVWGDSAREYDSFEKRWHFYGAVAEEMIRDLPIRRGSRILELACGTGVCTSILAGHAPDGEIVGLDSSQGMIDVAQGNVLAAGHTNVRFLRGDAGELSTLFKEEKFEIAVCNSAFLHFRDKEKVLNGLRDLLTGPRQFAMSLPSWFYGSGSETDAYGNKVREALLNAGVPSERLEESYRQAQSRRVDYPSLMLSAGFSIIRDEPFQFDFPPEARREWSSIPVFASRQAESERKLDWGLDQQQAAKVRSELAEWRAKISSRASRWRIITAEVSGVRDP